VLVNTARLLTIASSCSKQPGVGRVLAAGRLPVLSARLLQHVVATPVSRPSAAQPACRLAWRRVQAGVAPGARCWIPGSSSAGPSHTHHTCPAPQSLRSEHLCWHVAVELLFKMSDQPRLHEALLAEGRFGELAALGELLPGGCVRNSDRSSIIMILGATVAGLCGGLEWEASCGRGISGAVGERCRALRKQLEDKPGAGRRALLVLALALLLALLLALPERAGRAAVGPAARSAARRLAACTQLIPALLMHSCCPLGFALQPSCPPSAPPT
jgi:hypothetical protein